MNYYIDCFRKYFQFSGRARRSEFWYFVLFNALVSFALSYIPWGEFTIPLPFSFFRLNYSLLSALYSLFAFIPSIAVTVRRLHDTGRGGGWIFILLLPLIGAVILLVFMILDSAEGANRFGPNPKSHAHSMGL
ncbi:MAG: hypothetical protein CSA97_02770 [Bacteroidetes bacterium]|nr:MAG: hypothetical protein CSA97_02770 [Bacteroidota bacterium]